MSLLPHTLRVRKAPTTPRYSTSTDAGVSAFWVSTLEPCSGLCPFAYVTNVIQWRGGGGGGGGGRRGVGRKGGAKQNQWGIAEYSELFFRAKNVQRRMLNCAVKKKKKKSSIHLPLHTGCEYTQRHTQAWVCSTHSEPNLGDSCALLLSRLTTSSQVRNLVNNSLYLPAPLLKTYNVCIAAQVNE